MRVYLLAVVSVLLLGVVACNEEQASLLNDQALEHAYANRLEEALPLFIQATIAAPHLPEYHNNAGVTELRLGNLEKAAVHFEKALELDPNHQEALANMEEIGRSTGEEEEEFEGIQHELSELPRIPYSELFSQENRKYAQGLAPFVLTGAMETPKWRQARRKWSVRYFAERFPHSMTDFYPHNMEFSHVRPFITPWAETLREYESPSGKYPKSRKHPGVYIQWNLGVPEWKFITDDIGEWPPLFTSDQAWLDGCMSEEEQGEYLRETHWRMVLIGNAGAGMFNHQDTLRTSSFQAQVRGSKTWHLCGPDQNPYVYNAGDVDFFKPNYKKYPLARKASCYQYTVKEGEMVYYPRDWWHQTHNEEGENIAVTGTLVDGLNWDSVTEELQKDMYREQPIIMSPSAGLRDALPGCFEWLREAYGGSLSS